MVQDAVNSRDCRRCPESSRPHLRLKGRLPARAWFIDRLRWCAAPCARTAPSPATSTGEVRSIDGNQPTAGRARIRWIGLCGIPRVTRPAKACYLGLVCLQAPLFDACSDASAGFVAETAL
jgi:hypothetical protein